MYDNMLRCFVFRSANKKKKMEHAYTHCLIRLTASLFGDRLLVGAEPQPSPSQGLTPTGAAVIMPPIPTRMHARTLMDVTPGETTEWYPDIAWHLDWLSTHRTQPLETAPGRHVLSQRATALTSTTTPRLSHCGESRVYTARGLMTRDCCIRNSADRSIASLIFLVRKGKTIRKRHGTAR